MAAGASLNRNTDSRGWKLLSLKCQYGVTETYEAARSLLTSTCKYPESMEENVVIIFCPRMEIISTNIIPGRRFTLLFPWDFDHCGFDENTPKSDHKTNLFSCVFFFFEFELFFSYQPIFEKLKYINKWGCDTKNGVKVTFFA